MKYYLKKCGYQELGSVKDGKPQRGRYLLTSMKTLDFFPPLSTTQLNDSAILPIIPLYLGEKVYCTYVYHNSKFHDTTIKRPRNEYRIYLNNQVEGNRLLFQVDDIVIIRTEEITENDEQQTIYLLDIVQDKNSDFYHKLNAKIEHSKINGGYAFFDGVLSPFENKVAKLEIKSPTKLDKSFTNQIEKIDESVLSKLFNSVSFREFVMVGYETLCAITGTVIKHGNYHNLEAAHIKPKSHGGLFLPNNGIALCRDMHWAFDKGFVTINADFTVKIHPKTTSEWLQSFDNKPINLPKDEFFRLAIENLEYHSKEIFGLFLNSGRL
ncbi:MAG: HNH endonuclease [Firmicutes bacterium]|nr:HNH endonuclease [Bacillota bacterium]